MRSPFYLLLISSILIFCASGKELKKSDEDLNPKTLESSANGVDVVYVDSPTTQPQGHQTTQSIQER